MKAIRTLLIGLMMLVGTSTFAQPMNYNSIRNNARFLTDRMAYTLGVTSGIILDDLYRINYDYICAVNDYLDDIALGYRYDDYMSVCYKRDYALQMLLGDVIWNRLIGYDYFYRPIVFENRRWRFSIYAYDCDRAHFFFSVPRYYEVYRGGHFFAAMHPHHGHGVWGPGAERWGFRGSVMPNRRGDVVNHIGAIPRSGGSMDRGVADRGSMDRGNFNRGNMNRGGYQGNRSQSNAQSSSREGNPSNIVAPRNGNSSYGSRASMNEGSRSNGMSRSAYEGGMSRSTQSAGMNSGMRGGSMNNGMRSGGMNSGTRGGAMNGGMRNVGSRSGGMAGGGRR